MKIAKISLTALAIIASFALGQTNSYPKNIQEYADQMQKRIEGYNDEFKAKNEAIKKRSEKLQEDTDAESKKQGPDGDITFEGRVEMARQDFIMNVPEVWMATEEISFDVPVVETRNAGTKVNVPVVVMKTVKGPRIPTTTVRWRNDGLFGTPSLTVEHGWQETSYDIPTIENRLQEYSFDVPTAVRMERRSMKIDLPQIKMVTKRMSFDHPVYIVEKVYIGKLPVKDDGVKKFQEKAAANSNAIADEQKIAAQELKDKINDEMANYIANMFVFGGSDIVKGFYSQAQEAWKRKEAAIASRDVLAKQGIHPGDKRRAKLESEIINCDFMLQSLSTMANSALFDSHTKLFDEVVKNPKGDLSKEMIEATMSKYGIGSQPGAVDFTQPPSQR